MTFLVSNTALRDAFRAGDKAALTAVYTEYARSLFTMLSKGFSVESRGKPFVFRGYKEPWILENAVQEIFARAFTDTARKAYDGVRPYKNYLMTIARNYVVDSFRKGTKEKSLFHDVPEHRLAELADISAADNPETAAVTERLKEETAKFIAALNDSDRALFDARFVQGRSVESCAGFLRISEYRVKRDERRIKKSFFIYMRKRGFLEGFQYISPQTLLLVILSMIQSVDWRDL
jgi:RNA polymerase sigma factor (sigma-70 family)